MGVVSDHKSINHSAIGGVITTKAIQLLNPQNILFDYLSTHSFIHSLTLFHPMRLRQNLPAQPEHASECQKRLYQRHPT
jgi:hypothetical protein